METRVGSHKCQLPRQPPLAHVLRVCGPGSHVSSQALAERLLAAGVARRLPGSVRAREGTCLTRFRPALVGNVRLDRTYRFTWEGTAQPTVTRERRLS